MPVGVYKQVLKEVFSISEMENVDSTAIERIQELIYREGGYFFGVETVEREFWGRAASDVWLDALNQEIKDCPSVVIEEKGYSVPPWAPVSYLQRMSSVKAEAVLKLLSSIDSDNPNFYELICEIVAANPEFATEVYIEKIEEYLSSPYRYSSGQLIRALSSLVEHQSVEFAVKLAKSVIGFVDDPQREGKEEERRSNPQALFTDLDPQPRFNNWNFDELLGSFIKPLAILCPLEVAKILAKEVSNVIHLRFHRDELQNSSPVDRSVLWCQRVDKPSRDWDDPKEKLIHALTFACEVVYQKSPDSIDELDKNLRAQKWDIFERIRYHLFALNPNETTMPRIQELVISHKDYDKWDYEYEFQLMIRKACEEFRENVFSEGEKTRIFKAIQSGPSREHFKEFHGESCTNELFEKRKRHFHAKQFRPFEVVLFGDYLTYYNELVTELDEPITDEDYGPYKSTGAKTVGQKSPRPIDELDKMENEDLLEFLNEWDDVHREADQWWIDISFRGLAGAFQQLFKEKVVIDDTKSTFWTDNKERIDRPIYVRAIVKAYNDMLKAKQYDKAEQGLDFCEWVLSRPNARITEDNKTSDTSRENPDWSTSRRAVGDFVDACVGENNCLPFSVSNRKKIIHLLDSLSSGYDRWLDEELETVDRDYLTTAINNTRSRALESLFHFGKWMEKQTGDIHAAIEAIHGILEKRFGNEVEISLTLPECALLGLYYGQLLNWDDGWAKEHKNQIFPQVEVEKWFAAFSNFLKYTSPRELAYDDLLEEYQFALNNAYKLNGEDKAHDVFLDSLGKHLFTYFLWGVEALDGEESLLSQFYLVTNEDRKRWGRLFDHVGRSLDKSGVEIDRKLKLRIYEFFDWRAKEGEPVELSEFTFWFQAKCLEPEWRLKAFLRLLDLNAYRTDTLYFALDVFNELVAEFPKLVIECFKKLSDLVPKEDYTYFQEHKVKPLLIHGLKSNSDVIRESAEHIRENFLKAGRFEFLDIEGRD